MCCGLPFLVAGLPWVLPLGGTVPLRAARKKCTKLSTHPACSSILQASLRIMADVTGPPSKKQRKESKASMDSSRQQDALPVSAVAYRWNEKNVFHAISEDRMPADKLFDRPHYFAILDKLPVTPGHALMITKHKVATMLADMPPEAAADTMGDLQVSKTPVSVAGVTAAAAAATAAGAAAESMLWQQQQPSA